MHTWNFRVIKHDELTETESWFALHKVYYNKKGKIKFWTEESFLIGDSFDDIVQEVNRIIHDLKRFPVLKMSKLWKRKKRLKKLKLK